MCIITHQFLNMGKYQTKMKYKIPYNTVEEFKFLIVVITEFHIIHFKFQCEFYSIILISDDRMVRSS